MKYETLKTALLLLLGLPILGCQDKIPRGSLETKPASTTESQPVTTTVISTTASQTVTNPSTLTVSPVVSWTDVPAVPAVFEKLPIYDSVVGSRTDSAKAYHRAYNGEYPIDLTGKPLASFDLQTFLTDTIYFNQHQWNHLPRLLGGVSILGDGSKVVGTFAATDMRYREGLRFDCPIQVGTYRTASILSIGSPYFSSVDDDSPVAQYGLDEGADNWITITRSDAASRRVEGQFSLFFKPTESNHISVIIYPKVIHMHGKFKSIF